jgi:hypothetical protein
LAARFTGLNAVNANNTTSSQSATSEDIANLQNRIQNAQEQISPKTKQTNNVAATQDALLSQLIAGSDNSNVTEDDHNHSADLEMFKNVVNDPRFAKINQVPQGMSDSDLLRLFPNIKSIIDKDPSKEAVYLNNLKTLSENLEIKEAHTEPNKRDSTSSLNAKSSPADSATKKLIAATFLNMVGNNQALVDTLAQKGPKIFIGDISKAGSGGWFTSDNNMVLPKIASRVSNQDVDLATFAKVATHELGHWVDSADGNIDGQSSLLGDQFRNARTQVYQGISKGIYDHLDDHYEKYATSNPQEFFAVMGQFYTNNPLAMKDDMPEMYKLFANAYNMDSTGTGMDTKTTDTTIAQNTQTKTNTNTRTTTSSSDRRYGDRSITGRNPNQTTASNPNRSSSASSPISRSRYNA